MPEFDPSSLIRAPECHEYGYSSVVIREFLKNNKQGGLNNNHITVGVMIVVHLSPNSFTGNPPWSDNTHRMAIQIGLFSSPLKCVFSIAFIWRWM